MVILAKIGGHVAAALIATVSYFATFQITEPLEGLIGDAGRIGGGIALAIAIYKLITHLTKTIDEKTATHLELQHLDIERLRERLAASEAERDDYRHKWLEADDELHQIKRRSN